VQTLRPNVARDRAHLSECWRARTRCSLAAGITRYKLSEAEGHRVIEARHLRGKLVLMVR
jgi:hypothetical protein